MKKYYQNSENPVDFNVQKYFYDYSHHKLTGGSYDDSSNNIGLVDVFGAPSGNNSAISIFNIYDKNLAAYAFGGVSSFDIYSRAEKSEYNADMRIIRKMVEGIYE